MTFEYCFHWYLHSTITELLTRFRVRIKCLILMALTVIYLISLVAFFSDYNYGCLRYLLRSINRDTHGYNNIILTIASIDHGVYGRVEDQDRWGHWPCTSIRYICTHINSFMQKQNSDMNLFWTLSTSSLIDISLLECLSWKQL